LKRSFALALILLSSAVQAFGIYNVHALADVTEGGVIGLTLLLEHWLHISPAYTSFVFSALCYLWGWRLMGREFILRSAVAIGGFSAFYRVFERFPPLWPGLAERPLAAAVIGAVFVGVTAGVCVRLGGALGGDDALAMSVAHKTRFRVEQVYLVTDLVVLLLSASYIPMKKLLCSLLTVLLSGQIVGWIQPRNNNKGAGYHE